MAKDLALHFAPEGANGKAILPIDKSSLFQALRDALEASVNGDNAPGDCDKQVSAQIETSIICLLSRQLFYIMLLNILVHMLRSF